MAIQVANAARVALTVTAVAAVTVAGMLCSAARHEPTFAETPGTIPAGGVDRFVSGQMATEKIPGAAVVVVQEDRVIYEKGFGTASLRNPSPVTPQTVFDLASCSKSFTALAVLLLQDDGLVDLDAPITHYLPEFRLADRQTWHRITVRHLLNHTSGLPGRFAEPLAFHKGSNAMDSLVASMAKIRLNRTPGASFEYSDLNYALLGALIERVTGTTFEDCLEQRVFAPLKMTCTTLDPNQAASMARAEGHQPAFGRVVTRNTPVYRSAAPAGWVMSCAEDIGKWLLLHLNGGRLADRQVVPSELIQTMQTPGVRFLQNGDEVGYGMGWFTGRSSDGLPIVWHSGDTSNFAADVVLIPDRRLGVAVLVNSQNSSRVHEIAPGVISLVLGQPFELPAAPWWASWEGADAVATVAAALSVVLLLLLPIYARRRWRQAGRSRDGAGSARSGGRALRVWRAVLPLTPLTLLATTIGAIGVVVWALFGINVFRTLFRFGAFAPPGVWISGWLVFATIASWALALAAQPLTTAWRKRAVSNPDR